MVKGVDAAVFDAIQRVQRKSFRGGVYQLGLAEQGVGYVYDDNNRALIPDAVRARLESLKDSIVAGHIRVPTERP
jgi:basic membrane protein A